MTQLPETPLNILLIEDSDSDGYTIRRILSKYFDRPHNVTQVTRMKEAEIYLTGERNPVDVILLDLGLPDTLGGRDTYARLESIKRNIPVIILSNMGNHQLAVRLVEDGAGDFVRKAIMATMPDALCDAISFAVCRHKNIAAMEGEKDRQIEQKDQVIEWMTGGYSVTK